MLVVEDDPLLRMSTADMASEAGFAVLEAANADVALVILEGRDDIALVLSDIEMPGTINGLDLADVICDRWTSIPVILISGKVQMELHSLPEGVGFFPKPIREKDVVQGMVRMIGEQR